MGHDHHDHHHDHDHHHGHHHAPVGADLSKAFVIGIMLNSAFVIVEACVGLFSGSLALVADAGHNLSDVVTLITAWLALRLNRSRPTAQHTYGQRRWSILIALGNAGLLLVAMGALAWEAIGRFQHPTVVPGLTVTMVALIGLVINGLTAFLLRHGHELNSRAAFLHMVADALVSAGVAGAGLALWLGGWAWIDPATTLVITGVVVWSTWGLLREAVGLATDAVPPGIDAAAVRTFQASQPGVREIHDLHIWPLSTTETALTVHVVRDSGADDAFLHHLAHELREDFAIGHATIQIERGDPGHPCALAPDDVV